MRNLRIFIGVTISLLLLLVVLRGIDLENLREVFSRANYLYLLPASLVLLSSFLLRSVRWGYLVAPLRDLPFGTLFRGVIIGYFSNFILPANTGELVRTYLIGRRVQMSKSSLLATIVVEKAMDILALILFLVITLFILPASRWLRELAVLAGLLLALVWVVMLLSVYQHQRATLMIERFLDRLSSNLTKKVMFRWGFFVDGLGSLRQGRRFVITLSLSLGLWATVMVAWYLTGRSLNLALSLSSYALPLSVTFLASSIPTLPGRIGTFEFLVVACLGLLTVESSHALALAVLVRGIRLPPLALGYLLLSREGFGLAEVRARAGGSAIGRFHGGGDSQEGEASPANRNP